MGDASPHAYEFGPFRLIPAERLLVRAGEPVRLTPKEFDLLLVLVEQRGRLVEKSRLMDAVWPGTTVEESNLTQTVFTLRRALGQKSRGPLYIETVPKRGYRFAAEVAERREEARAFRQLTFRRGPVHAARFTPDPSSVVHDARWEGEPLGLFALDLRSLESRRLDPRGAGLLAASRAGGLAVLLGRSFLRGYVSTGTLARTDAGGGGARALLEAVQWADFSPDGAQLAAVRDRGGRNRLEYPLGRTLYETGGWISHPRVSPAGDAVAFLDHPILDDDSGSVSLVSLDGERSVLSDGWISASGLAWSPEGREVWFTATRKGNARALYAVGRDGGRQRLIERVAGSLTLHDVSADGRALVARDSTRLSIACRAPGETAERDLSWRDWSLARDLSPDGRWLLFTEAGEASGETYAVYLRATDGAAAVRLGDGSALALSPDGRWALARTPGPPRRLALLPTGAGEPRALAPAELNYHPWAGWLPGGDRVVFAGNEPGRGTRLYVQDTSGGRPRALDSAPEGVQLTTPHAVSPGGERLAAVDPGGEVCLYPLEGRRGRRARGCERGDLPVGWDASGRHLYVRRRGEVPVRVYRVEVEGGAREFWRELMPSDTTGVSEVLRVLLTPDGEHYAYTYTREFSDLYLVEGLR